MIKRKKTKKPINSRVKKTRHNKRTNRKRVQRFKHALASMHQTLSKIPLAPIKKLHPSNIKQRFKRSSASAIGIGAVTGALLVFAIMSNRASIEEEELDQVIVSEIEPLNTLIDEALDSSVETDYDEADDFSEEAAIEEEPPIPDTGEDITTAVPEADITEEKPTELAPDPLVELPVEPAADQTKPVEPEEVKEEEKEEKGEWNTITVKRGDNLSRIFKREGLSAATLQKILNADPRNKQLKNLRPGDTLDFLIDDNNKLSKIVFDNKNGKKLEITHSAEKNKFTVSTNIPLLETKLKLVKANIKHSLFVAGEKAGLSYQQISKIQELFGWQVDFNRGIRKGDKFSVLYEERFRNKKKIGTGDIVAAKFVNRRKTYYAIRYSDNKGNTGYYNTRGNSTRKMLLRAPLKYTRISSKFNPRRRHPIKKTIRPHRGVDYAAPRGTPVKAGGDGRVIKVERQKGYGKVIFIRHAGGKYTTVYGHLSRFRKGLRKGKWVRQGQTIGYVGSTGLSSGPHLHYEIRINGKHKDPTKVKLPDASHLPRKERKLFKAHVKSILKKFRQTQ